MRHVVMCPPPWQLPRPLHHRVDLKAHARGVTSGYSLSTADDSTLQSVLFSDAKQAGRVPKSAALHAADIQQDAAQCGAEAIANFRCRHDTAADAARATAEQLAAEPLVGLSGYAYSTLRVHPSLQAGAPLAIHICCLQPWTGHDCRVRCRCVPGVRAATGTLASPVG